MLSLPPSAFVCEPSLSTGSHMMSVQRQRPIYERAVKSFGSVIKPNARVRAFIAAARSELLPSSTGLLDHVDFDVPAHAPAPYVAVHMRHGDLKPLSLRYGLQPIPVSDYAAGISKAIDELALRASADKPLIIYAASDSVKAVEGLQTFQPGNGPACACKVVSLRSSASPEIRELAYPSLDGYRQDDWAGSMAMLWTDEERVRYTTGMIVDLALLSGLWPSITNGNTESMTPSAVICGIKCVRVDLTHQATLMIIFDIDRQFVPRWH